jgi:hypothetical protein
MKTSIMHLMGLFLVLAFTASCGKKSSSGSSNSALPYTAPGTAVVVGSAGHNALINWLNTPDTATGMQAFYVKKQVDIGQFNFNFSTGLCQMVGINLPGCIKPTQCLVSNGLATDLGTTVFDNLRPKSCTLSGTFYTKANDTALREAVLGKTGRFVLINQTTQSGAIYTVYYSLYNGSTQITGAAVINTSLPAALNPVLLQDASSRTKLYFLPY